MGDAAEWGKEVHINLPTNELVGACVPGIAALPRERRRKEFCRQKENQFAPA